MDAMTYEPLHVLHVGISDSNCSTTGQNPQGDVLVIADASGSLSRFGWANILNATGQVMQRLEIGEDQIRCFLTWCVKI